MSADPLLRHAQEELDRLKVQLASAEARAKELEAKLATANAEICALMLSKGTPAQWHANCHARTRRAVEAALAKAAEVHPEEITSISPDEILRGLKDE